MSSECSEITDVLAVESSRELQSGDTSYFCKFSSVSSLPNELNHMDTDSCVVT